MMLKGLTKSDIIRTIREFGIKPISTIEGIEIGSRIENGVAIRYRFECGSGIAGQLGIWWLVPINEMWGKQASEKCDNVAAIRRVLREWISQEKK